MRNIYRKIRENLTRLCQARCDVSHRENFEKSRRMTFLKKKQKTTREEL